MTTQVPASRVPIVDHNGLATPAFYRFLLTFFQQAGGVTITASDLEAQLVAASRPTTAAPAAQPDMVAMLTRLPLPAPQQPDLAAAIARAPVPQGITLGDVFAMLAANRSYASEIGRMKDRIETLENALLLDRVARL